MDNTITPKLIKNMNRYANNRIINGLILPLLFFFLTVWLSVTIGASLLQSKPLVNSLLFWFWGAAGTLQLYIFIRRHFVKLQVEENMNELLTNLTLTNHEGMTTKNKEANASFIDATLETIKFLNGFTLTILLIPMGVVDILFLLTFLKMNF